MFKVGEVRILRTLCCDDEVPILDSVRSAKCQEDQMYSGTGRPCSVETIDPRISALGGKIDGHQALCELCIVSDDLDVSLNAYNNSMLQEFSKILINLTADS